MKQQILFFILRGIVGVTLIVGGLFWSDYKGMFDAPINDHPHQVKRWASLKNLHETDHNVDVLILGNSHAFTGINPKHLSAQLGMTAFVMANNSMNWVDSYWTLREALNYCKPQIIVLETYGLDNYAPEQRSQAILSNQIRAFDNRSDIPLKIASTLDLFTFDEIGLAWSPTVRNHHYLWNNQEQLRENLKRGHPIEKPDFKDFYLGRFVRFSSGLSPETLAMYDSIPAPIQGSTELIHEDNILAGKAIAALCRAAGIRLMIVTLPMYHKHVANADLWAKTQQLAIEEIGDVPWINMQADSTFTFNPDYFENTIKVNQHMTHKGSIAAAKEIGLAIEDLWGDKLERHWDDEDWLMKFSSCEGFFAYNSPSGNMANCQVLEKNLQAQDFKIEDILLFSNELSKDKAVILQLRLTTSKAISFDSDRKIRTIWRGRIGEQEMNQAVIDLAYSPELSHDSIKIFRTLLKKEVELDELRQVTLSVEPAV